jgi:predicted DNA-binding transcriptional regulator AlpA
MTTNSYMTTQEVAQYCGVSIRSVERWRIRKNDPFPAPIKLSPGPQKYYSAKDVMNWMQRTFNEASQRDQSQKRRAQHASEANR